MRTADFHFELPPELVAQTPARVRDQSRLLVLHRSGGGLEHKQIGDLPGYLRPGDLLVLNDSRVIPARLQARNRRTGGAFEVLLLEENARNDWWAMLRPSKRARLHTALEILDQDKVPTGVTGEVAEIHETGLRRLRFEGIPDIATALEAFGDVPLPPYITRETGHSSAEDRERYQTVYARVAGSVAAPTAGLHFTPALLERVRQSGVGLCFVTLHIGAGTFTPVKAEKLSDHHMHAERFEVSPGAAEAINRARREGRRIIAVGTTSLRVLETLALAHPDEIKPGPGVTRLFVYPPFRFRIVTGLLTNFHLPQSTLLMLVSAFAAPGAVNGTERVLRAYEEAVRERYRFFSYGDAMLLL